MALCDIQSVLICMFTILAAVQVVLADYTAAVVEYKAISWLLPFINEDQAKAIINLNLDVYDYHMSTAVSKGADIIVFPEYGITGFVHEEREYIVPYLETVPDPLVLQPNTYIPCHERNTTKILIQYRLSCLALKHNITVVANLMTVQQCDHQTDPNCPPDGRYQYNTDVSFTSSGQLVARYHKENLYTGEAKVFNPGQNQAEVAAFKTSFGYFGLFTCFDILFANPADRLVNKLGVDTMVFPTAWMNELPLLSAAEYQQAWSLSYGVNVLASNQHYPIAQMTGSGIFSPVSGAVTYLYDMNSILGQMLVGKVKSITPSQQLVRFDGQQVTSHSKNLIHVESGIDGGISSSLLSGIETNSVDLEFKQDKHKSSNAIPNTKQVHSYFKEENTRFRVAPEYFIAKMNDDPYNFTLLQGTQGRVSVSNNNVSCVLDFVRESDSEMYALGAFDGLHTMNGDYYIQSCGVIHCKSNDDPYRCGAEMSEASTLFQSFRLVIEGQSDQTRLFPEVLTSGVKLPQVKEEWDFSEKMDWVWSKGGSLKEPLLAANIFGRWYQRD